MPNLEKIYDSSFFSQWGSHNRPFVESARIITDELYARFKPRRMIDLGCGCGVYVHWFSQKGTQVVAVDGVCPPAEDSFAMEVELRDLTEPFENVWGEFDMALCLDVGEHIPEEQSQVFLENITQFSDTLILACAPPGQGGLHHVNEQPKRYWKARLAEHGFDYNKKITGQMCETFKVVRTPFMWMWEHVSLYQRR